MAENLRTIENRDFEEVSALFKWDDDNSVEELKWLFTDPDNHEKYNAYVVEGDEGIIIGVIGYIKFTYRQQNKELVGVTPMSWMLREHYKGLAGVALFRKVMPYGDVSIAIGGSKISMKLYPMFKYKLQLYCTGHHKVLRPMQYYPTIKKKSWIKKIGKFIKFMPSYVKNAAKSSLYSDVSLVPYDGTNFAEENRSGAIFHKVITKNYIDWLLDCPSVQTFGFVIQKGAEPLGVTVLYIKKKYGKLKGRIVQLPYLGDDSKMYASVMKLIVGFFKEKNCCLASGVSINKFNTEGFDLCGFKKIENYDPIFIKDDANTLDNYDINTWNLQFSEGDMALRNFH